MIYEIKTKWFDCCCHHPDCSVRFLYGEYPYGEKELEKDDADLTLEFQMTIVKPWYKRVVDAIKYIFKIQPRNGHWSETVLSYDNIVVLRDFLNDVLKRPIRSK